jgi:hypothetical protein
MPRGQYKSFEAGRRVTITKAPRELLNDLPILDQKAVAACVGKPGVFVGVDLHGNLEVEFSLKRNEFHTIFVNPTVVVPFEDWSDPRNETDL